MGPVIDFQELSAHPRQIAVDKGARFRQITNKPKAGINEIQSEFPLQKWDMLTM